MRLVVVLLLALAACARTPPPEAPSAWDTRPAPTGLTIGIGGGLSATGASIR